MRTNVKVAYCHCDADLEMSRDMFQLGPEVQKWVVVPIVMRVVDAGDEAV